MNIEHPDGERVQALLLLGATGTGKTPLGEYLEDNGLNGQRCVHFDFGAALRSVADGSWHASMLTDADAQLIKAVLASNILLEDDQFYIAKNILKSFLEENKVTSSDKVVLNGLPRHKGQAADMFDMIDIQMVVVLDCAPGVVYERIRRNTGGDRAERRDDSDVEVERKLEIFRERTMPLVDYFKSSGVRVEQIDVAAGTMPSDIVNML